MSAYTSRPEVFEKVICVLSSNSRKMWREKLVASNLFIHQILTKSSLEHVTTIHIIFIKREM